jgi:hypothetical protein
MVDNSAERLTASSQVVVRDPFRVTQRRVYWSKMEIYLCD